MAAASSTLPGKTPAGSAAKRDAILRVLRAARRPLTAYEIMERTRSAGVRAPTTASRALAQLVDDRLVHRIESINAFVACCHGRCEGSPVALFSICSGCGTAAEFDDPSIARRLRTRATDRGFAISAVTLEMRGLCQACAARQ